MAASGTDVFVSVPSTNGLNRDERSVINSLMYLKRKRQSTNTESIYKVCNKDYDIDKTLCESILNNLIMIGKVERKLHSGKTSHKLLFEVGTTWTEEDRLLITPIEEVETVENIILEEVNEVISEPIFAACHANVEFESFVTQSDFMLLKDQVERLLANNSNVSTFYEENVSLKRDICFLKDELESKNEIIRILQQSMNSLERENSKLSTNNINNDGFVIPKRNAKSKQRSKIQSTYNSIKVNNRFETLTENDKEHVVDNERNNDRVKNFKHIAAIKSTKSNHQNSKMRKTVIIGDSMIKGIQSWKLKKSLKENVQVKTFHGASIEDMKHYIIPTKEEEPNVVILHVGTNNLKNNQTPESLASNIIEVGKSLCTAHNDVIISGICHRNDEKDQKVSEVNDHLKRMCNEKKMFFLDNDNIKRENHLNNSGLHLNTEGNSILASNIIGILKC